MSRWRGLPSEQRQAALAAAALAATLLLPWYQTSSPAVIGGRASTIESSLNAFEAFSFVEAAILLVAAGVLYLLWARSEQRAFHLPGGDGWVISAAGAWGLFLLVWRLFDKPDVDGAAVGVQWGIFLAMAAAGALAAAGQRVRAAHRPEPPNPAEDDAWERGRARRRFSRTQPVPVRPPRRRASSRPDALTGAPEWEGDVPEPPTERLAGGPPAPAPAAPDAVTRRLGPARPPEKPGRKVPAAEPPDEPPAPPDRLF